MTAAPSLLVDGRPVAPGAPAVDPTDRGLLLGDGVFATMTAFSGRVYRRDAHLDRLAAAAARLDIPVGRERLADALDAVVPVEPGRAVVVRLTVTRGPGPRGLHPPADPHPTVIATTAPWSPDLVFRPVRLALAESRRNERTPLAGLKHLGYLDAVLAGEAAARRGFDDALFLNTADRVACSTMANVFVLRGRRIATPPLADGVLPGIVRARLLEVAPALGLSIAEAPLGADDLAGADAVFLTNSVRLVAPVAAFETRTFAPSDWTAARLMAEALRADVAAETGYAFELPG